MSLNKIAPCYSVVFNPYARRADRASKSGTAHAVFGFKAICKTLAEIDAEHRRLAETRRILLVLRDRFDVCVRVHQ